MTVRNRPRGTTKKQLLSTGKSPLNKPTIKPIRKPRRNEVPVFLKTK